MVTYTYPRTLSFFGMLASAVASFAFFYTYSKLQLNIQKIQIRHYPKEVTTNFAWFQAVSVLIFGTLSAILSMYELLLIVGPRKFKWYQYSLLRGIIYIATGCTVVGVAGDLGVFTAPFCLLLGLITVLSAFLLFCGCMDIVEAKKVIVEQPGTSIKGAENV